MPNTVRRTKRLNTESKLGAPIDACHQAIDAITIANRNKDPMAQALALATAMESLRIAAKAIKSRAEFLVTTHGVAMPGDFYKTDRSDEEAQLALSKNQ